MLSVWTLFFPYVSAAFVDAGLEVSVCNFGECGICAGGEEAVVFAGKSGWNYVVCEMVGFSVNVTATNSTALFQLCEILLMGSEGEKLKFWLLKETFR